MARSLGSFFLLDSQDWPEEPEEDLFRFVPDKFDLLDPAEVGLVRHYAVRRRSMLAWLWLIQQAVKLMIHVHELFMIFATFWSVRKIQISHVPLTVVNKGFTI